MTKLIAVFGSTGKQGGSVVRHVLKDGFKVRAFTRNPDSDASKKLKELGGDSIEIVKCDESQPIEVIEKALKGSDGVYLVTNTDGYPDKEIEYGKKVADAALAAGVKHIVFSSLPSANKISNGKHSVPDLDNKAEIEVYIRKLSKDNGDSFISSFIYAPWYYQNFLTFFAPTPVEGKDGVYEISMPNDPLSKYPLDYGDINEIGIFVSYYFKDPLAHNGEAIQFTSEQLKPSQIVDIFSKVTGKKVIYNYIPPSVYKTFGPDATILAEMVAFFNEFDVNNVEGVKGKEYAHKISKLSTFEEFLIKSNFKLE